MSLIRWYITIVKNIDPDMVHPSIWGRSTREFNELSEKQKERLKDEWRRFTSRDSEEKKEVRESVVRSGPFLIFEGKEVPPDLRMDEIRDFLDLPQRERERQLKAWLEREERKKSAPPLESEVAHHNPVQLGLFQNPKISTLLKALKKVSNVR